MIVRWGVEALPGVLEELSVRDPLLISTERWRDLDLPVARRFYGARPHAEIAGVRAATEASAGADGLVALGGGSAIDTSKAVSSETGLPIVSIPTTYSGAEWTQGFGMRDPEAGIKRGGGGARTVAIVYDPELTLGLPRAESAGSAMNALAHCAEALYTRTRSDDDRPRGARRREPDLGLAAGGDRGRERSRGAPATARGRDARRRGAVRRDGPRPRDGAGPRRPLRARARDDERGLPAARAPLQRGGGGGGHREAGGGDGPRRPDRARDRARRASRPDPAARVRRAARGSRNPVRGNCERDRRRKQIPARRRRRRSASCSRRSGR